MPLRSAEDAEPSDRPTAKRAGDRLPSVAAVYAMGIALLLALYTIVFAVTLDAGWPGALSTAIANVVPLAGLAAGFYLILHSAVLPRSVIAQGTWHIVLAPVFALSWYALVLVSLMLLRAIERGEMAFGTFSGVALVWQLFQGVVLYALVAACAYALRGGRQSAAVQIVASGPMQRYLTRQGDELVPIAVGDIVTITGAQDYAEVTTIAQRRHLVRLSLGEFEQRLPADEFLRIHRSVIVNLRHLDRAEPAGSGRMTLHLSNGQSVEASRTGARALRDRVI
ncbi:LytTR family DNA-binding domain-containing protein [Erythrobacter sp. W302b]|uniref:LytTR family DNA-binding domain-containing protein n=1 Tax=Erythrobacter sp. W302b TaxID=3389874 RepID=UPI00396B3AE8